MNEHPTIEELTREVALLRRQDQRLRLILDGVRDHAITMLDPEGRVETFNAPAERIKGYPLAEVRGKFYGMFFTPEDRATGLPEREIEVAREVGRYEGEGWRLRKDGSRFYAMVSLSALRDASGELVGFVKVTQDITERKLLAEEARVARDAAERERARLRQMFDAAPAMITLLSGPELRYEFISPLAVTALGLPLDQILGRKLEEVAPESSGLMRQTFERGEVLHRAEEPITRDFGHGVETRFFSSTIEPLRDQHGQVDGLLIFAQDVTERRRTEITTRFLADASATLGSSLDYRRTLATLARLCVPTIADWAAVDMLDPDRTLRRLAVVHVDPSKVELAHDLYRRWPPHIDDPSGVPHVLRTGRPEVFYEISDSLLAATVSDPELMKTLRTLGLSSAMCVPLTVRGRVVGAISLVAAESGRRFSADSLALAEELALRASIAIEHASLYREATEASKLKDEFLATVSHEVRTPLTAILGWANILRSRQNDPAYVSKGLETIERNARVQAQLIEDLLDLSRIITGKLRLEVQFIEIGALVETALDSIRPAAAAKDIKLRPVIDPKAGPIMGDPGRLVQVVNNLLTNATKFTPKGGTIRVWVRRADSSIEIVVQDNGAGIEPEFLPYVFERFRQADGSITRSQGGLGLGLAICRSLVELHGGTITADSEGRNRGATFTVRLPIAPLRPNLYPSATDPVSVVPPPPDCPASLEGLRVLVVDDEVDTRELLVALIEGCKAIVKVAASAAEALEMLRRDPPDVLVSDVGMPGEDGLTFIRKVRALTPAEGGRVPAIALTAYASTNDRTRALVAGFNQFVSKPIENQELLVVIANVMGRFQS